jgi:hypothetical protein
MSSEDVTAKFLRLQNGDDIIAETIEYEDDKGIMYMVVNPLKVVYVESQYEGYLSISFMPWVFSKIVDHQEFMIHADDVLLISDVSEKMNIYYWENFNAIYGKSVTSPEQHEDTINQESLEEIMRELNEKKVYH